jgi:hypothetical protein
MALSWRRDTWFAQGMRARTICDRVTVRALRDALDGRTPEESAIRLRMVAGSDVAVLRRALTRVQRRAGQRPTAAARRAAAALHLALLRTDPGTG